MFIKHIIWLSLLLRVGFFSFAQKDSCIIYIFDKSQNTHGDYYLASNINKWNPKDENYKFRPLENKIYFFVCYFDSAATIEWKVTRGSWETVERDAEGRDQPNHIIQKDSKTQEYWYSVRGWKNLFPANEMLHTASKNVHIVDSAFYIPQLDRERRIWIYLPEGYSGSHQRYPVLYMQDGQNVFDRATSAYGEWGVDECLDSLYKKGVKRSIVVAIDCGDKRTTEYNPYTNKDAGFGDGDAYMSFLVKTLKPYIDKHYRTLKDKENTMIAGSSMGALISYYTLLKYPQVFGRCGVFSPAFWIDPDITRDTDSLAEKVSGKVFFYMGGMEGKRFIKEMYDIEETLAEKSTALIYSVTDPVGIHNENAWRSWFPEFYKWIMGEGYKNVLDIDE